MINVHMYDSYIIPRRWYIWNGIVESIQLNINDELNVQVQSLFITEMNLLSEFLRISSVSLQITCFTIYTNTRQLFVLTQIPPTVDIYNDIYSNVSKFNILMYCSKLNCRFFIHSDGPILQFWWRLIPQAINCM